MKKTIVPFILLALVILGFGACKMAQFDKYPGEQFTSFPDNFQGHYVTFSDNEKDRDTILIQVMPDRFILQHEGTDTYVLGKKYFLSKAGDTYFLSEKNDEGRFFLFGIREYDKHLLLQPFLQVTPKEKKRLAEYFESVTTADSTVYYKMNDEKAAAYYQKYVRRKDGMKLIKMR